MTCIIGVRCVDGVVLAGDRRVLRGTEYSNEPKIKQAFSGFVVGASGLSGLMDKFLFQMELYLQSEDAKKELSWWKFLNVLEDIAFSLFTRYGSRLNEDEAMETSAFSFNVLCGCKEYVEKASLYHLYGNGFAQKVNTFDIIGHGTCCALPFIKSLYAKNRTMKEMAKVCAFTLKLIDEANIDVTVGGEPQIFLIPDNGQEKELTQKEIDDLLNLCNPKEMLEALLKL